jgi:hypothetical protein
MEGFRTILACTIWGLVTLPLQGVTGTNTAISYGLYYKNIRILNDTSRVIRMTPQLGASLMIVTLMTLEVSLMVLELSIEQRIFV